MIQNIAVDTQILHSDINAVQEALDDAKSRAEKMFEGITELSSMWEGSAHDAFTGQFHIDYESMENLFRTISELIDCMRFADKEYNSCETAVEMIINSIRV